MKRIHLAIAVVVLLAQAVLPTVASAQSQSAPPQSNAGERMLRNALIGAAIGAAVFAPLAIGTGDCGSCAADNTKAILSGAMYGALIGAAIRVHPSRRPTPGRPSRTPTISPHITRHVKAMNVVVRF